MSEEISLKELLDTTFSINENGEMVGEFTLKRINMIGDILTNQYKRIIELEEIIRKANNNVLKDIAMIKTHEMIKQEIVQRLIETSKILESESDEECTKKNNG